MLEGLGLSRVETYIQSGNAAFDSDAEEQALVGRIEAALSNAGVHAAVVLRTADEMRRIVENLPFSAAEIAAVETDAWDSLYVALFPSPQTPIDGDGNDRVVFSGRAAYLFLGESIRLSKCAARVMKLEAATTRNWKTILKMREMTGE